MKDKTRFTLSRITQKQLKNSMFKRLTILWIGLLCTGALLQSAYCFASDSNKDQLKNIQQNIAEKEKAVKQQQQQRQLLLKQLKTQEKSIAQASRLLRETQNSLTTINKEIADLNSSITSLQKQQQQQQKLLAKQLDLAFRQGHSNALQLILSAEESQRKTRMLAYFGYLNHSRQKLITTLQNTHAQLAAKKQNLLAKQKQQKSLLSNQQEQQQKLAQAQNARKQTLNKLETALQQDKQRLTELRRNETQLREKIARAQREARARAQREAQEAEKIRIKERNAKKSGGRYQLSASERALMARTGGLGRPAKQALWPVYGPVLHQFGESLQGELRWKGVVIGAPEGKEVRAIADGRVLLADWLQGYGLVVVVDHGKGDMSLYGYNQSALVNVGTQVTAGQPIALVGTSGGQGHPALYFEIRRQGQAVDPLPWLGK